MARNYVQHHSGFGFHYTDLGVNVFPPRDACVRDTLGWLDIDGDGCLDFICIGTASGNYEDTDHEVVAIHTPTGNAMWRTLRGEASKKLGLVGGVLVVSTNSGNRLRGLDPRNGGEIWNVGLEDAIQEDPYDGDDRAPAISSLGGTWAGFECVDDTYHVIDVRNGMTVRQGSGKLHPAGWNLPGFVAVEDDDDNFELWNLASNQRTYRIDDASQVRTLHSSGFFAMMHRSDGAPGGSYLTKVAMFDASGKNVGTCWVKNAEGDSVDHGASQYGVVGGMMLGGMRTVWSDPYSDDGAYVTTLAQSGVVQAQPLPPPRPGYNLKAMTWCAPVLATVWEKSKGTPRLLLAGHDPNTLGVVWGAEDLGGHHQDNLLHATTFGILVPKSNDNYFSPTNPACLVQFDPQSGAKVTEYPVEAADCVGLVDHFLVGSPDYFSGGMPVIYDTWNRTRLL